MNTCVDATLRESHRFLRLSHLTNSHRLPGDRSSSTLQLEASWHRCPLRCPQRHDEVIRPNLSVVGCKGTGNTTTAKGSAKKRQLLTALRAEASLTERPQCFDSLL